MCLQDVMDGSISDVKWSHHTVPMENVVYNNELMMLDE